MNRGRHARVDRNGIQSTRMTPTAIPDEVFEDSHCTLSILGGPSVTLWSCASGMAAAPEHRLQLKPDQPAIIGRANGCFVPYLDPAYQATPIVPGTGQTVLLNHGHGEDRSVSRGHFMLRAAVGGVLLVNGVPFVDGGIRPPFNGTYMCSPERRSMEPGEEYLIAWGKTVSISLPNRAQLEIRAG